MQYRGLGYATDSRFCVWRQFHYGADADGNVVEANPGKLEQGCTIVLSLYGRQQFAKLMDQSFITEDGEAIEGELLEDVIIAGRVTFFINRAGEDDYPV